MPTISGVAAISMLSLRGNDLAQQLDVAILDVPAIAAQVDRDALGTGQFGDERGGHRLRFARPPRLPEGGDVVDVEAESSWLHLRQKQEARSRVAHWRRRSVRLHRLVVAFLLLASVF